jgi:predicted dehydrogenase
MFPDVFEVVGYALVENERVECADALFVFDGYPELSLDEILNDPTIEAVTVETDEIHLTKYATLAVEHGKHIHMEKPGSQNLADFENLIDEVRRRKKVFHTGYMYRYNPFVKQILAEIKAGEFGDIHSVEAHMDCKHLPGQVVDWLATFKGGMMFYLGCHLVDLVMLIKGVPDRVIPLNTATGIDGVDTEDLGFAVMQYPNAVVVVRMGGTEIGGFNRRQLVICGEKRTVEIKPLEAGVAGATERYMHTATKTESFRKDGKTACETAQSEPFQRYRDMMRAFAAMVRGERENPYTLEYELELLKTIMKCCGFDGE